MKVEAARLLVYRAAWRAAGGAPDPFEASVAKAFTNEAAVAVCNDALQIHGGYGYTREYPVERMHRDAKIYDIFEGTEQIQQLVIARAISGDGSAFLICLRSFASASSSLFSVVSHCAFMTSTGACFGNRAGTASSRLWASATRPAASWV